jgi:hypothetical protein
MVKNKSRDLASDIIDAVREGTKKWTRTVKAEERSPASRAYRASTMTRERGISIKEAAAQIMEWAYREVSGGTLPANARQIMYKARPHILKVTGRQLDDNYFTQTLLPDYQDEHGLDWVSSMTRADISSSRANMVSASALRRSAVISPVYANPTSSTPASARRR